jgi:hypothetical protein
MRKERRKIAREDYNVLHDMFDTLADIEFKRAEEERKERLAKEEAERCPTDVAGELSACMSLCACVCVCRLHANFLPRCGSSTPNNYKFTQ